jgi:hypothetical protein
VNASKSSSLETHLIYILIPLLIIALLPLDFMDLGMWVAQGRKSLESFQNIYHDSFSVLATDNNVSSAWLQSIFYALIEKFSGLQGILYYHYAILLCLFGFYSYDLFGRNHEKTTLLLRLSFYISTFMSVGIFRHRPALAGYLLTFVSLKLILNFQNRKRDYVSLMMLQLLWVNLHASFILLPMFFLWSTFWKFIEDKKLINFSKSLLLFLFLLLSCLANPFGLQIFPYLIKTAIYAQQLRINEWMAPHLNYHLILWSLLFLILYFMKNLSLKSLYTIFKSPFFILIVLSVSSMRNFYLFVFFVPLMLKELVESKAENIRLDSAKVSSTWVRRTLAFVFAGLFLMSMRLETKKYLLPYLHPELRDLYGDDALFEIAKYINTSVPNDCALLNNPSYGSFLMMQTSHKIFLDGRSTVFTPASVSEFIEYKNLQATPRLMNKYKPCLAVLAAKPDQKLIEDLIKNWNFSEVARERGAVLLRSL